MTPEEDLAFYGPEKRPDFAARAMAVLNRSVAILVPNYTVTIATMEELCIFFLKHTGVL